jgi:uncharacterized membrane protein YvbJ
MICPNCGAENPDGAAQCSVCNHKFRFGHAFNDPESMSFLPPARTVKAKILRYVFFALLVAVFVLLLVTWFRDIR